MNLPVTVKEILVGYLVRPYVKDLYLYLAQNNKMSSYCVTWKPLGKQCPTNYPMPLNPNWYTSGREEHWNGDKQKLKELELKNSNIINPRSPKSQSMSTTILMKQCLPHNLLIPWCH